MPSLNISLQKSKTRGEGATKDQGKNTQTTRQNSAVTRRISKRLNWEGARQIASLLAWPPEQCDLQEKRYPHGSCFHLTPSHFSQLRFSYATASAIAPASQPENVMRPRVLALQLILTSSLCAQSEPPPHPLVWNTQSLVPRLGGNRSGARITHPSQSRQGTPALTVRTTVERHSRFRSAPRTSLGHLS